MKGCRPIIVLILGALIIFVCVCGVFGAASIPTPTRTPEPIRKIVTLDAPKKPPTITSTPTTTPTLTISPTAFISITISSRTATPASGGPTALCKDGTYSYAANHRGACSGHGGVQVFYR